MKGRAYVVETARPAIIGMSTSSECIKDWVVRFAVHEAKHATEIKLTNDIGCIHLQPLPKVGRTCAIGKLPKLSYEKA